MDNARILCGSLDIGKIEPFQKDNALRQFLDLLRCFRTYKVNIYKENGYATFQYSYGYADELLYKPWREFKSHPAFDGLSQNVFQLIAASLHDRPGLGKEINSSDWERKTITGFKCDFGLDIFSTPPTGYIIDQKSWHTCRCSYYQLHQDEIPWHLSDNDFLPNKLYSNELISEEVNLYKDDSHFNIKEQDELHVKFHDGIVRHKGSELRAYIERFGGNICLANFYKLEDDLSKAESKRTKSPRTIYSIINRNQEHQFISLDFAHGMFEYIDAKGDHLGEFRVTGHKNSAPETDHGFPKGFTNYL